MAHAWNGCSQSSRFPTAGQGERSSGNEIGVENGYKGTAAVTDCFLELHLTWFKKYHLLSPNYTTISFFVPINETEALIPAVETLPIKWQWNLSNCTKNPRDCSNIVADSAAGGTRSPIKDIKSRSSNDVYFQDILVVLNDIGVYFKL